MNYIGEHTFWALAGRFFTYLAFTGALGTFVFYALNWLRPGACSGPDAWHLGFTVWAFWACSAR